MHSRVREFLDGLGGGGGQGYDSEDLSQEHHPYQRRG